MRTGAECVVKGLEEAGVEIIFGLPGGTVLDIFAELYHSPIKFVLARHEQGATHMADGYARATGKIGCCIATSGPGATNTVTGLATAHMDGIPMVCITGQVPSSMIGNDAFQEADTTGITRAITKHNYLVKSVDELPGIIAEAFHVAGTGKQGPVVVDIPKDIQQAKTAVKASGELNMPGYRPTYNGHPGQIAKLAKAINHAEKPLLYVGGGVISGEAAAELTEIARKGKIPVTTTLMGMGAFPNSDPLSLSMVGMHGSATANYAISQCDLLVSVGARFDDRVTGKLSEFAPNAMTAHIDIDPSAIDKSVSIDIPVVGHVKQVLPALLEKIEKKERKPWLDQIAEWKEKYPFKYDDDSDEIMPQYVIEQICEVSKGEAVITTEVGQSQMWAAQFFQYSLPRTFISSGGLGTMGYGLPASIGAQAGLPDKTVVNIAGDGSIQMNFQELVVAVEHDLPINIIILNNGHLGMVRQWQDMFYKGEYSATVLKQENRPENEKIDPEGKKGYLPDFIKMAEAHGAVGIRVTDKKDVVPALRKAFDTPRPVVVECIVKEDADVYPMVPPGAGLMDVIVEKE